MLLGELGNRFNEVNQRLDRGTLRVENAGSKARIAVRNELGREPEKRTLIPNVGVSYQRMRRAPCWHRGSNYEQ